MISRKKQIIFGGAGFLAPFVARADSPPKDLWSASILLGLCTMSMLSALKALDSNPNKNETDSPPSVPVPVTVVVPSSSESK